VGPDGVSVRRGDQFVACETRDETIEVRGADPVVERVLVSSHGPIIGPALDGEVGAIALRATWLLPSPVRGQLVIHRARDFDAFRRCFDPWPAISLNYMYADMDGTIGWQLVGDVPQRRSGAGLLPAPGWEPTSGWLADPVPFEAMPHAANPECGFLASANNKPVCDDEHAPFLGADWIDGFRVKRIADQLASRQDWDIPSTQRLQLDVHSVVWDELRDVLLDIPLDDPVTVAAHDMLAGWDGNVESDSSAATVFEELVDELDRQLASTIAPNSTASVLGFGFHPLMPGTVFGVRRQGRLIRALRASERDRAGLHLAPQDIAAALATVVRRLSMTHGQAPDRWARGRVHPLWFRHRLGQRRPLDRLFNLGPLPGRGDSDTVSQYTIVTPVPGQAIVPSARVVIDLGDWNAARFSIPGGQSGNPLSAHYADLLQPWSDGSGIALPWTHDSVVAAASHTLRLCPLCAGHETPEPLSDTS
jgi:penicillin amidase